MLSSVYICADCTVFYNSALASSNFAFEESLYISIVTSCYCPQDFSTITARKEMNSDEFRRAAHASIDQSMQESILI